MNKRQARQLALEIAIAVIDKEWSNPSDLTETVIEDNGFDCNLAESGKVYIALADLIAELQFKKDRKKVSSR